MRGIVTAGFLLSGLALAAGEMNRPSPEFAFTMPGGRQDLLSNYKGKVVVLEFLFTTCPHCQQSATMLSRFQREYGAKGLQVMGVAINPDPDIAGFSRQFATGFPVASGTRDAAMVYLQQSVMTQFYVPQIVFIDRKGVIRAQYGGTDSFLGAQQEANVRGMIEKLLAEGAGKPAAKAKPAKKTS